MNSTDRLFEYRNFSNLQGNISDLLFDDKFWSNFKAPQMALPVMSQAALISVYGLIAFFAVFGNLCVMIVLAFGKFILTYNY